MLSDEQIPRTPDGRNAWLVGIKEGGLDDATHIVRSADDKYTLCGMHAVSRNVVLPDAKVHVGSACWGCVRVVQEVSR